jgi:hypothetical protein
VLEAERPKLVSCAERCDGFHAVPASVLKSCLVRFDNNKYSVTASGVGRPDDAGTPWIKKRYVNGNWAIEDALDPADSSYVGVVGGGIASITSGSTVDLGSVPQANVTVTGTTTIIGFGSSAPVGIVKFLTFDDALTITHSSSLKVPGGYPVVTAADDTATVKHLGSGNWQVTQFTRASGIPIDVAAVGKASYDFAASVPPLHVAGFGQTLSRATYPALFRQGDAGAERHAHFGQCDDYRHRQHGWFQRRQLCGVDRRHVPVSDRQHRHQHLDHAQLVVLCDVVWHLAGSGAVLWLRCRRQYQFDRRSGLPQPLDGRA